MTILLSILLLAAQATDKEADAAIAQFKKDYKSNDVSKRTQAVGELVKVEHLKVLNIASAVLGREETDVRAAAAGGLGAWKAHRDPVIKALGAVFKAELKDMKSEMPYEPFLEAFGKLRAKTVLPDIHTLFQYWDPEYCDPAVKAVGVIRGKDSIEPLLRLWARDELQAKDQNILNEKSRPAMQAEIAARAALIKASLKSITDKDFASSSDAQKWWKDNKATFKDPP